MLAYPGEIRESQLENLVDRQLCKSSGADGVAGGEHVDEVAVKLGQGASPDPVRIAGDWLSAVIPVVVIGSVAKLAGFSRPNQTCRVESSRRPDL